MKMAFIPSELIHKICEYVSIKDMIYIKQVSKDFYDGCRYSKDLKKAKLRDVVVGERGCDHGSFVIKREDEETFAILVGSKRLARIEHKLHLKIYDTEMFGTDEWIDVLGNLLKYVGICEGDLINMYKSNVFVLLYRGRLRLL